MPERSPVAVSAVEPRADLPLKDLVAGLGRDMGLLVRQEIALARAEITEQASHAATGAASIGIGAFLGYAGMLAAVAALVLALVTLGVIAWLAAAITAAVLLAAGYATLQAGRRRMAQAQPMLRRTRESTQETVHRLKEQLQ
jgi:hypothetical protein